jgi:hypothetical protein
MRKNELMRTRAELELYDSGGDGWLTENDLQQYVEDLLPRLPALTGLLDAFVHFYKAATRARCHRPAARPPDRQTAGPLARPQRTPPPLPPAVLCRRLLPPPAAGRAAAPPRRRPSAQLRPSGPRR